MKTLVKASLMTLCLGTALNASSVYAGNQPLMENALRDLERAERSLERAARNKGGHRAKALNKVRQAMKEVKLGMEFANRKRGSRRENPRDPRNKGMREERSRY